MFKKESISPFFWNFVQKFSAQGVQFIVQLILARLLFPEDFGLIALAATFFNIARSIIESGMRDSLIQMKSPTDKDYSTIFFFNLGVSIGIYALFYFLSPYLSNYFESPELAKVIKVLSLVIVIESFGYVQLAVLVRNLKFKKLTFINAPALFISGAAGITLAFLDFGVWALVFQLIIEKIISTILLWINSSWRPKFYFSMEHLKYHVGFGYSIMLSNIANSSYKKVFTLVIAKFFGVAPLGLYNRAESMRSLVQNNTSNIIVGTAYPMLSKISSKSKFLQVYRNLLKVNMLITLPIAIILFFLANFIIILLFTEKWEESIPLLKIISLTLPLYAFDSLHLNLFKIARKGRRLMFSKVLMLVLILIPVLLINSLSFEQFVMFQVIIISTILLINHYMTRDILNYSLLNKVKDLVPILVSGATMGLVVWSLLFNFNEINWLNFLFIAFSGSVTYILTIIILMRSQLKSIYQSYKKEKSKQ